MRHGNQLILSPLATINLTVTGRATCLISKKPSRSEEKKYLPFFPLWNFISDLNIKHGHYSYEKVV